MGGATRMNDPVRWPGWRMAGLVLAWLLGQPAQAAPFDARAVEKAVAHAMKTWGVPGASVVIVQDDRVVYCQGHGVREVGNKAPVAADTVFPLASCTKAFTAASLAILVDDGVLHWDDPVRKHLPWFHLSDPLANREVRLRDLLCHRTGLAGHDMLWYRADWSPEESVRRAGKLPLARPFRTEMQYQSTMYTAAGLAAGAAAKSTWADLVHKRLLTPLGMKDTCLTSTAAQKTGRLASGHRPLRGDVEVLALYPMTEPDPAGSVYATAADVGRWLRFHLSGGMAEGKRLVSARALGETHRPQMVMRLPAAQRALFPNTVQLSYAMGWVVHDHQGVQLLSHGGAIAGHRAQITLVPGKRLGLAVLSNLDHTPMNMALCSTLVDHLLGLPARDWHRLHADVLRQRSAALALALQQRLAGRRHDTHPTLPLSAYAGTYEHPAYGAVRIELKAGMLVWRWRDEAILDHFHDDTFRIRAELAGDADITFHLRAGAVASFHVSGSLDLTFTRQLKRRKTP